MVGDILQPTHLLFVLVVALLVLGPKRLPEVARQLGNGLRDFRSAISGEGHHESDPPDQVMAHPDEPYVDEHPDMSPFHDEPVETAEPSADGNHADASHVAVTSDDADITAQPVADNGHEAAADHGPPAATPGRVGPTDKPA
jgi:sec-independent protein translocase protein TatA